MAQHVLPVLCPKGQKPHLEVIQANPGAQFCPFCGTRLSPIPIEIEDSPPRSKQTVPSQSSAQTITIDSSTNGQAPSHVFPSGNSRIVRDDHFLPSIHRNSRKAIDAMNQSAQHIREGDSYGALIKVQSWMVWNTCIDGFSFFKHAQPWCME